MKKQISIENERKINELLNDNDAEILVKHIINEYTNNSLEHAQDLLHYINDIVANVINITSSQIRNLSQAAHLMIFQTQMNETDVRTYFATMLPIVKTLFPDGYPVNGNLAQKEYFDKFLNLCKNKKAFSWNKESDVDWLMQYDYYDYLEMIWSKYIHEGDK